TDGPSTLIPAVKFCSAANDAMWQQATFAATGKKCSVELLDYPVGNGKDARRDVELERAGGAQVDDEFEFGGLLHRKITRFLAFEDAADVNTGLAGHRQPVRPIAHQTARGWKLAPIINRRNSVAGCQRDNLLVPGVKKIAPKRRKCTSALLHKGRKCPIDVTYST